MIYLYSYFFVYPTVTSLFRVNFFDFIYRNIILYLKATIRSIQYEKEFLILITSWPSKEIFFERKGLIPRSDPLCTGQWWIEINFNNKWAAELNRSSPCVNLRLEIKKKKRKKRREYTRFQRIRNFTENWNNFALRHEPYISQVSRTDDAERRHLC